MKSNSIDVIILSRFVHSIILLSAVCVPLVSMADRGPAYLTNTPGVSEQEKEWHYQYKSRVVAREQEKERNLRRVLAALPDGERERAVLIAASRLAELQFRLQSPYFQNQWAEGVDPNQGTAAILFGSTMSLGNLAAEARMPAANKCHMFEALRLRRLSRGEVLQPASPCREAAYGGKLIDATTAAGDQAIPKHVDAVVNGWAEAVLAKSLAAVAVDGLVRIPVKPNKKD